MENILKLSLSALFVSGIFALSYTPQNDDFGYYPSTFREYIENEVESWKLRYDDIKGNYWSDDFDKNYLDNSPEYWECWRRSFRNI